MLIHGFCCAATRGKAEHLGKHGAQLNGSLFGAGQPKSMLNAQPPYLFAPVHHLWRMFVHRPRADHVFEQTSDESACSYTWNILKQYVPKCSYTQEMFVRPGNVRTCMGEVRTYLGFCHQGLCWDPCDPWRLAELRSGVSPHAWRKGPGAIKPMLRESKLCLIAQRQNKPTIASIALVSPCPK